MIARESKLQLIIELQKVIQIILITHMNFMEIMIFQLMKNIIFKQLQVFQSGKIKEVIFQLLMKIYHLIHGHMLMLVQQQEIQINKLQDHGSM